MAHDRRTAVLETIDQVLRGLAAQRVKRAEPLTEPGGYDGPSEHPTADADDGTQRVSTGDRYREHQRTIRDQQNNLDPESQDDVQAGTQDAAQMSIGMESTSTGETPEEETEGTKDEKDDPGTDHPARTDNEDLNGGKYAAAAAEFTRLRKEAADIGNQILADISVLYTGSPLGVQPSSASPGSKSAASAQSSAQVPVAAAWHQWLQQRSNAHAEDMIQLGISMAEKVAAFYDNFFAASLQRELGEIETLDALQKAAQEAVQEALEGETGGTESEGTEGAAEQEAAVPDLGMSDEDVQALMEALLTADMAEAEGGSGEAAPAEEAASPAAVTPEEEELAMLAQAMEELGVQPEELAAAAAAKTAAALRELQSPGRGRGSSAKAQKYARIRDYVMELTGRKA